MREFWTNVVISESGYVLCMFLLLLVLSHLFFVYPKNLSKRAWKKVDYIWLGVAAIGLLSIASDVRVATAKNWFEMEEARAIGSLRRIIKFYPTPENTYLCFQFIKGEYSSDGFEEFQHQHDLRCNWLKKVSEVLKELDVEKLPELSIQSFPIPNFDKEYLFETVRTLEKDIGWYQEDRRQALETKSLLSQTDLEKNLFYFSPFLLCLALALRIAKVTGELRYDK